MKRFGQVFTNEAGFRFTGTLQPVEDMKIYADDYFPVRQILRVFTPVTVRAGDVIRDTLGQRYLLGELDRRDVYEGFRLYPLNRQVEWLRPATGLHPLTGEPVSGTPTSRGQIWILSEVVSREARGAQIKVSEEVKRILTGADVQLNDLLGGERVVKMQKVLGIKILEVV